MKTDAEILAEFEKRNAADLEAIREAGEEEPVVPSEDLDGAEVQADAKPTPPIKPIKLMDILPQEQAKSDKFFKEYVNNNPAAKRAMKGYTSDGKNDMGHSIINSAQLGNIPMTPAIDRRVKAIQKLTDAYDLDKDITVYRGLSADYIPDWEVGKTVSPKMFTSISANIYTARRFAVEKANPTILEIRVAKGTKGVYIGDNTSYEDSSGKHTNEEEFLMGNNVKYTVVSKEKKGVWNYWIVEARNE